MVKNKILQFITGNNSKFQEAQAILSPFKLQKIHLDLDEIQEVDPKKIIEHKLKQALKYHKGPLIVDDSSLFLSCFNYKLPGPLIKWFNEYVGVAGIAAMVKQMKDSGARAETYIGYAENQNKIIYFKGSLHGKIVPPKGNYGFGYDQIFMPDGKKQTLSELKTQKNFVYSPRGLAISKLKKFLQSNLGK